MQQKGDIASTGSRIGLRARIRYLLPKGNTLPHDVWLGRHRWLVALLAAQGVGLVVYALFQGFSVGHSMFEGGLPIAFAVAAWVIRDQQRLAATTCSVGLITVSAVLVHISGGLIEAHFHFFVMIILLTLYEDWLPFLVAAAYVLLHHGIVGLADPSAVYNHPDAIAHPLKWAAIHALFVTGAGLAAIVAWRLNEAYRFETEQARTDALKRADMQRVVARLGEVALAATDLDRLFREAVATTTAALAVEVAMIGEWIPDDDQFVIVAETGLEDGLGRRFPAGRESQSGSTLLAGRPVVVDDWETEDRFGPSRPITDAEGRSSVTVIIRRRDTPFGVLGALSREHRKFDEDDVNFIQALANVLSAAIERVEAEADMRHRALHDPLTGLPNRILFVDRLEQALAASKREPRQVGVLFCDLDQFKLVNDSLGHDAGDELLGAVAPRLGSVLRGGDTVARFGGDEFGILVAEAGSIHDITRVAERLAAALSSPFVLNGHEYFVSASVGIAIGDGGEPPEALIRDADLAMHRAKERGRGRYEIFDELMRARAVDHLRTESDLRRALGREELVVHYQPVISLPSGQISGFEALVRWQHPERGLLGPGEFISLAEESGLIVELGDRVLQLACAQTAAWHQQRPDMPPIGISVNISPRQVADPTLPDRVRRVLRETNLDPLSLSLEVTESVLVDEVENPMGAFAKLRDLGAKLALDDFGTGFSSLGYLQRYPFDLLKIDRSFIEHLGDDPANAAIVKSVTAIAEALGLGVVAEGIETEAQLAAVTELGCHYAQGFYFSRPVPADEAIALLDEPAKIA